MSLFGKTTADIHHRTDYAFIDQMASPAAQAYPRIRDAVESFVADVQDYTEDAYEQLPTTTITESNTFRDRKYEYTVEQPSKIVRDTPF